MNRSELAGRLADRIGMSKAAAKDAVDGVFETIGEALANGEEAQILRFGTFGTLGKEHRAGPTAAGSLLTHHTAKYVALLDQTRRLRPGSNVQGTHRWQ